jgi:hypothetical protein
MRWADDVCRNTLLNTLSASGYICIMGCDKKIALPTGFKFIAIGSTEVKTMGAPENDTRKRKQTPAEVINQDDSEYTFGRAFSAK